MQNQFTKTFRRLLLGGLITFILCFLEMLIANLIFENNPEAYKFYASIMLLITMFFYMIFFTINIVKHEKQTKNQKQKKLEEANKELTTEFKQVLLNYSEPISKDLFKCYAKIDDDGKIFCKIELDYEVKIDNYEKFLRHFHFDQK